METKLSYGHLNCPRCTRKMKIARTECDFKNGVFVFYCYSSDHVRLKLVVFKIGTGRFTISFGRGNGEKYSLRELKCLFCRRLLWFDKSGSYNEGGKWTGRCKYEHIEIRFLGKLVKDEPTCEEVIQVIIREWNV